LVKAELKIFFIVVESVLLTDCTSCFVEFTLLQDEITVRKLIAKKMFLMSM